MIASRKMGPMGMMARREPMGPTEVIRRKPRSIPTAIGVRRRRRAEVNRATAEHGEAEAAPEAIIGHIPVVITVAVTAEVRGLRDVAGTQAKPDSLEAPRSDS